MDRDVRLLLLDALRRGRTYFLLAAISSLLASIQIVKAGELSLGGIAVGAVVWMGIPQFLLTGTQRALCTIPIDARSVGRMMWWSTYGGFALSSIILLALGGLSARAFGHVSAAPTAYLGWIVAITGLCGHAIALPAIQAAEAWATSSQVKAFELRVIHAAARTHLLLVGITLLLFGSTNIAIAILAIAGFALALLSYRHAEYLTLSVLTPATKISRHAERPELGTNRTPAGTLRRVRDLILRWLTVLVMIAVGVLYARNSTGGLVGITGELLAILLAVSVMLSGIIGVGGELSSIYVLCSLPLTTHRIAGRLTLKSSVPALTIGALAFCLNLLFDMTTWLSVVTITLYLASLQTLWPGFALNQASASSRFRIMLSVAGFVFSAGGCFAIVMGGHWLAWIGAPMVAAVGYNWTRRTIERGGLAGRTLATTFTAGEFLR